jgi:hypothetical protein
MYQGGTASSRMADGHEHALSMDEKLVADEHAGILQYLSVLYPDSRTALQRKSPVDIVDIYDTLDIVFNCITGNGTRVCVSVIPDGYFYSWKTYMDKRLYTAHSSGRLIDNEPISDMRGGSNNLQDGSAPAPANFPRHAYCRNIYYPFGPLYDDAFSRWTYLNGIDVNNTEGNMGFLWTHNSWAFGLAEGESVEVSVSAGSATSPGLWLTPFFGGGTGLAYTIGKTLRAVNKMDMLMKLLTEYRGTHGDELVLKTYGTTDPYTIVWRYCASTKDAREWGAMAVDGDNNPVIYPGDHIFIPNTGILAESGMMNKGSIGESVRGKLSTDVQFGDLATWYSYEYGVSVREMIKASIDAVCKAEDWILDRVCLIKAMDEPIFWLGVLLGYKTLQFTVNASPNGTWEPMILDLTMPSAWRTAAEQRRYVFLKQQEHAVVYTDEAGRVFANIVDTVLHRATVE